MNSHHPITPSLDDLIQDLEDGTISSVDRTWLMAEMRRSPQARALYREQMEMISLLKQSAESRAELGTLPLSDYLLSHGRKKRAWISLVTAAAAVILLSLVGYLYSVSKPAQSEPTHIVLDSSVDAEFEISRSGDGSTQHNTLEIGDSINLTQGTLQCRFPSGAEAIIEAPSHLKIRSPLSLEMKGGTAWFRVPEAAHGFTVEMEQMKVIDLGTEFGVLFNPDDHKEVQVHVAKGKVRVEPMLKACPHREIIAGKALSFDFWARSRPIAALPSLFRRTFTRSIPYIYWSFDEISDDSFPSSGTLADADSQPAQLIHVGKKPVTSPGKYRVKGRLGKALSLKGDGTIARSTYLGISGNTPRTIAAWIRHRRSHGSSNGSLTPYFAWGGSSNAFAGKRWKLVVWDKPDFGMYTSTHIAGNRNSIDPSLRGEWMHIASVYTGQNTDSRAPDIRHYVNGKLLDKGKPSGDNLTIDTRIDSANSPTLHFGYDPGTGVKHHESLDGDIDEAYIFRGVLNAKNIINLMENRLPGDPGNSNPE